jgi:glycosyltransferase involved in cell wall biosynthesis
MNDSYYKNYKNKISLKSDINLYKKLDKNNKTIFLFWDKKFAKRTKILCNLKSIIKIIPPTLSIDENHNKKLKTKINKKIKILFIGKVPKIKGLYYLLKALKHNSLNKFDYRLDVISNTTKHNTKKIFFHKNINNIKKTILLKEADIFILPSIADTFGYSLMEAIANKCAIITCDYHPLNIFCKKNYNGFLVKKHNHKDISKSLLKLFQNKTKLKKFKENSFKLYKKNFSQKKFINKFKVIFNEYNKNELKSDI